MRVTIMRRRMAGGRMCDPGTEVDLKDGIASLFIRKGDAIEAAPAKAEAKPARQTYSTRVMSPGPTAVPETPAAAPIHPLDHDANGEKGGALKQPSTDEIKALRAQYEEKLGKKPFMGWDEGMLRDRIAAAGSEPKAE